MYNLDLNNNKRLLVIKMLFFFYYEHKCQIFALTKFFINFVESIKFIQIIKLAKRVSLLI